MFFFTRRMFYFCFKFKFLTFTFILLYTNSFFSQYYLDTVGYYVQFRQDKGADVFTEINLGDIHFDYVNVKAKGKLGSYKIRYNHSSPSSKK